MNVSVLMPTRGDRPRLLQNAMRLLEQQTLRPTHIEIVNDPPLNPKIKDVSMRYRLGCERILEKNPATELILFFEDDDWYSNTYLESMYNKWVAEGKPQTIGLCETIYYHLGLRSWCRQNHPNRASAMSTGLTPDAARRMKWPADGYVFTDLEIWKNLPGHTFAPPEIISIGMKGHNEGLLFGGIGHRRDTVLYRTMDRDFNWLRTHVDPASYEFYMRMSTTIR